MLKKETLDKVLEFLGVDLAAADLDVEVLAALEDTVGEAEVTEMQNRIKTLEVALVNRDLDAHGITDAEERKTWSNLLNADRESGLKALANRKTDGKAPVYQPFTNRNPGQPPKDVDAQKAAAEQDTKTAARITNRAAEIEKTQKIPFSRAHALAVQEITGEK